MGKARRFTISRNERFLGSYSYGHNQGDTVTASETELHEEDVWSMVDNVHVTDHDDWREWSPRAEYESNETDNFHVAHHCGIRHVGGLSLTFEDESSSTTQPRIVHHHYVDRVDSPRGQNMATSAPLNVPNWSKIYRADSGESMPYDSNDDGESNMMPPHEYLAGKKSGGASVFEGVGRTLKGRDMSRVRDAVWSRTGFYG